MEESLEFSGGVGTIELLGSFVFDDGVSSSRCIISYEYRMTILL